MLSINEELGTLAKALYLGYEEEEEGIRKVYRAT